MGPAERGELLEARLRVLRVSERILAKYLRWAKPLRNCLGKRVTATYSAGMFPNLCLLSEVN